jgi:hypothetical protein
MTQLALPGLGKIEESEFVDFHEGVPSQNASKYFDATMLPDAAGRQSTAAQSYILYLVFPSWESLREGIEILTCGERIGLSKTAKFATLSSVSILKSCGKKVIELWRERLL